jgi:hypothetical protein
VVEEEGVWLGMILKLVVEVGKNSGNDWKEEI